MLAYTLKELRNRNAGDAAFEFLNFAIARAQEDSNWGPITQNHIGARLFSLATWSLRFKSSKKSQDR